jgi:hypothetical protein
MLGAVEDSSLRADAAARRFGLDGACAQRVIGS